MASKYELIGSIHRQYEKEPYKQQEVISIPGISLNSLENIDRFTSSMTEMDIMEALPEQMQDKNHFSIRVWTHFNDNIYYIRTIFNDPEIHELLLQIEKKAVLLDGRYKTLSLVPKCPLVNNYWEKIEQALNTKDLDALGQYFSTQSKYYFKLERYLNSGYDYGEKEKALQELKLEFRDYRIFRKVYVSQKRNYYASTPVSRKNKNVTPAIFFEAEATFPHSEDDYREDMTYLFNTQSEKEEFLSPEEYEMCNPGFYDTPAPRLVKSRRTRPKKSSRDEN